MAWSGEVKCPSCGHWQIPMAYCPKCGHKWHNLFYENPGPVFVETKIDFDTPPPANRIAELEAVPEEFKANHDTKEKVAG